MTLQQPRHRLFMGALLRAIAKVPVGQKLDLRALREPLDLTQADTIRAIETLIDEGRLDRATLRPVADQQPPAGGTVPRRRRGQSANGQPARPLFDALVAEGKRRGLTIQKTSLALFGNKARIYQLTKTDTVRWATADKVRAWIAAPPSDGLPPAAPTPAAGHCEGAGQHAKAPAPSPSAPLEERLEAAAERFIQANPPPPTGTDLADRLERFIAANPGITKSKTLKHLRLGGHGLDHLRHAQHPRQATIDRVLAFLADPPIADLQRQRYSTGKPARRRPAYHQGGDPTVGQARQAAALRRSQTAIAERILEKNPDAIGGRNQSITTAIANVRRQRDEEARRTDPVERAKLALRKRGRVVFDASVDGGRKGRFFVSGQNDPGTGKRLQLTAVDLIALAMRVNPREMERLKG